MCRTCRHIDPSPSFAFIGPPPSLAVGRRLARPPLPAIRDLDRAPPPPKRSAAPPPPAPGRHPQRPAGARGDARTPPSWHQLGEKRKCWLWELKNRPPKIDESSIFAPKGAPFIFGQVLKKSRRSNEYFERYSQKTWGEGRICPPFPVRVLSVLPSHFSSVALWPQRSKMYSLGIFSHDFVTDGKCFEKNCVSIFPTSAAAHFSIRHTYSCLPWCWNPNPVHRSAYFVKHCFFFTFRWNVEAKSVLITAYYVEALLLCSQQE